MKKEDLTKTDEKLTAGLAWKLFEKTGSISYYMLFSELNNKDKK